MNSKIILSVIVVALSAQGFEGTVVRECLVGIVPEVTVTIGGNVCGQPPCKFKVGDSIAFDLNFTAPYKLTTIKADMMLNVVPLPTVDDACPYITNTHCPIPKGQLVVYKNAITMTKPIKDVEPMGLAILDSTTEEWIACFTITVENA